VIESCTGSANQQRTVNASTGTITSAADSSRCLDATGEATADGTLLNLATCSGSTSQSWKSVS
jgi:Ricin-type beta-trefoil lectin domain